MIILRRYLFRNTTQQKSKSHNDDIKAHSNNLPLGLNTFSSDTQFWWKHLHWKFSNLRDKAFLFNVQFIEMRLYVEEGQNLIEEEWLSFLEE